VLVSRNYCDILSPACWSWPRPWPLNNRPGDITTAFIQYRMLYGWQNGRCAICGGDYDVCWNGTLRKHCVDHDHGGDKWVDGKFNSGLVRGLLCWGCNKHEGYHNGSHNRCDDCRLFEMYRVLNPMVILGFEVDYDTFIKIRQKRQKKYWSKMRKHHRP
jgi:hypothetical protein